MSSEEELARLFRLPGCSISYRAIASLGVDGLDALIVVLFRRERVTRIWGEDKQARL